MVGIMAWSLFISDFFSIFTVMDNISKTFTDLGAESAGEALKK